MPLSEHPRSGNLLTFLQGKLSPAHMRSVMALLSGSPAEILRHLPPVGTLLQAISDPKK